MNTKEATENEALIDGVRCVGIDNKRHVCLPESKICKCGVAIKRKKLLRDDYKLFSCYECAY